MSPGEWFTSSTLFLVEALMADKCARAMEMLGDVWTKRLAAKQYPILMVEDDIEIDKTDVCEFRPW